MRNKKLELQLRKKLELILKKPEYEKLPMLVMNNLDIAMEKNSSPKAMMYLPDKSSVFIITQNKFEGKKMGSHMFVIKPGGIWGNDKFVVGQEVPLMKEPTKDASRAIKPASKPKN